MPWRPLLVSMAIRARSAELTGNLRTAFASPQVPQRRSKLGDVDDSLSKGLRRFLRQVVPDAALNEPVLVFARELLGVGAGVRMRCAVGVTFKRDGGHGDDRTCGQALFQVVEFGLAFGEGQAPSIIVDHDVDMVRIVESRRAAIESGVVEIPLRRSSLPDQLRELTPILFVT